MAQRSVRNVVPQVWRGATSLGQADAARHTRSQPCQTRAVDQNDLVQNSDRDARDLLVAAQTRWDRPVPHCPDWDAAGLVRHMGFILQWMAAIVATGERVSRRTLEPAAPEDPDDLSDWYVAALDRTLDVFTHTDPARATWTFSTTGDQRAGWWRRRLAVEVATHRWDVERAVADGAGGVAGGVAGGAPEDSVPRPLDGDVASAGIEEFVIEFLPGLLTRADTEGITGTLQLLAVDPPAYGSVTWWIDLDDGGKVMPGTEKADTAILGTRSDLLLWLQNRGPLESLEVFGNQKILDRWGQLAF